MLRILFLFVVCSCTLLAVGQEISGNVYDQEGAPLPFSNVILLNTRDSSFVDGTVTDTKGYFSLPTVKEGSYLLQVSSIGYNTKILPIDDYSSVPDIYLLPEVQNLSGVIATAERPVIKADDRGISVDIQNSTLRDIGTANDVLGQLPFVSRDNRRLSVLGRGAPVIYLNGRQVRNLSELDQINSNTIKKITVITNPSAEYSYSAKAVINIETSRPAGEGWSGNAMAGIIAARKLSGNVAVNLNYRIDKLDIFGSAYYYQRQNRQNITREHSITQNSVFKVDENIVKHTNRQMFKFCVGANYAFDADHSAGIRYESGLTPLNQSKYNSVFRTNQAATDAATMLQDRDNERTTHSVNAYYQGKVAPWLSMKVDMDFIHSSEKSDLSSSNKIANKQENIYTKGNRQSDMFASKAVFTSPIANSDLLYGLEVVFTGNKQLLDVQNQGQAHAVISGNNTARQRLLAAFVSYYKKMGRLSVDVGMKYEHAGFDYFVNNQLQQEQSKTYDNLSPNINLSYSDGNIRTSLGYSQHISRPSYYLLRNNTEYSSPYSYERGNPLLRPSIDNNITYSFRYRNFILNANYDIYKDFIMLLSKPYSDKILISQAENVERFDNLSIALLYSLKVGSWWKPSLELGFEKNFFAYGSPTRYYDKPVWSIKFRNGISLSKTIYLGVDMTYNTDGHSEVDYMYGSFRTNVYLSKTFFGNRLRVTLKGDDIFGTDRYRALREIDNTRFYVDNDLDSRSIALSVSYNFNTTRSKYKGTGAGNSEKERL